MMFPSEVKANGILSMEKYRSPTEVQRKFLTEYGRHKETPSSKTIKKWFSRFKQTGSCKPLPHFRNCTIDRQQVLQCFTDQPKQSLRRCANNLEISHSSVRRALKSAGMKCYRPQIVQMLNPTDSTARVAFAETVLAKI